MTVGAGADAMLSSAAVEYFRSASGLSRRVVDASSSSTDGGLVDISTEGSLMEYFHAGAPPFTFRSRSQTELAVEADLRRSADIVERDPQLDKTMLLSHTRMLSELKTALKNPPAPPKSIEFKIKPMAPKPPKKSKGDDDREPLVSPSKRCQIVASSDNFFRTDFGNNNDNRQQPQLKSVTAAYKSASGLEEARALLSGGSMHDSLGASTDSEFLSCEDTPVDLASPSSSTGILPKTGYDFLDNW